MECAQACTSQHMHRSNELMITLLRCVHVLRVCFAALSDDIARNVTLCTASHLAKLSCALRCRGGESFRLTQRFDYIKN